MAEVDIQGWGVACVMPQFDRKAEVNLTRQGIESSSPRYLPRASLRPQLVFPGYRFVSINDAWRSICGTHGVQRLMMNGERPALLPAGEVDRLNAMKGADGLVTLPQATFRLGQFVTVEAGAFAGLSALYDGQAPRERCYVLLSLMGRSVRTTVPEGDLAAA